jgi:hemerythrin
MEQTYLLGIPEMDAQHEEIFALVGRLHALLTTPEGALQTRPALEQLHRLLVRHFRDEEAFMRVLRCEHLDEHLNDHARLVAMLDECLANPADTDAPRRCDHAFPEALHRHVLDFDGAMTQRIQHMLHTPDNQPRADTSLTQVISEGAPNRLGGPQ